MIKNRVYLEATLGPGQTAELDQRAAHYLRQVLRLRTGDTVALFNGGDEEYAAELRLDGKKVYADIVRRLRVEPQTAPRIHLIQAVSRGDRMDFSIQKAVELGVARIVPVYSGRSIKVLDEQREEKKMRHWHGVIVSACEQSGRCRLPELERPLTLADHLERRDRGTPALILDPTAASSITRTIEPCRTLELLIGPEGGWTDAEVETAANAGVTAVTLGPRILRTETAGLAALAVIQAQIGDFK